MSLLDSLETPKVSDRATTDDLMARLRRHYIKPGQPLPGGVFIPEVGWNGGVHASRADAIYVGFTGTSGRLLVGHEVKASRSDWLNELNKPGKADAWADQCHEWWLVTPRDIVRDGELPDGWGHMVPGRSKTRMDILVRARRHHDRQPSWDATRSLIARQDTLRSGAIYDAQAKARDDAHREVAELAEQEIARRIRTMPDAVALQERLARIEKALGGQIVEDDPDRWYVRRRGFTDVALADVAELLRLHGRLTEAAQQLVGRYSPAPVARLREHLVNLDELCRTALAELPGWVPNDEEGA